MLRRQFLQLISDLRAELERSSDPAVGVSDYPTLKQKLNRVYETLYDDYDWPHLMRTFDPIDLHAGQRYYDLPDGLDYDRIERVVTWWNGLPVDVERGIDFEQYAEQNSEDDARLDPVMRWDVRYDEPGDQEVIETWPIPATEGNTLQFRGIQKFEPLVDDSDVCRLDDKMVVLFAAADLAPPKSGNKQLFLDAANKRKFQLQGNSKATSSRVKIGAGDNRPPSRGIIVRVGG